MIDTITIEINAGRRLRESDFQYIKEVESRKQNATNYKPKSQSKFLIDWPDDIKETDKYLPEVCYADYPNPNPNSNGRYSVYRITVSLPKLLYGNNVLELSENQFDELVRLLHSKIVFLGLPTDISIDDIKKAKVRRVDFSKNIMLSGLTSMQRLSEVLAKAEHKMSSKNAQVQYRNNGQLYREHIKNRAVIVYDKLSEFCENKANHNSDFGKFLVSAKKANLFQITRFEVQIQSTQQLKTELKSLKRNCELVSFKDIFNEELARQILLKYWGRITENVKVDEKQLERKLLDIFISAADTGEHHCGPQKAYAKVGFSALESEIGANEMKSTFYRYYGGSNWASYRNDLSTSAISKPWSTIADISKAIEEMNLIGSWEGLNECF